MSGVTVFKRYGIPSRVSAFYGVEGIDSLSREELIQVVLEQRRLIEQLRTEIERLKRGGSAAPFSKGFRKPNPKRPGRRPGEGPFLRRAEPADAAMQERIAVPITVRCCPDCGGALGECEEEIVTITDMPGRPKPEVRVFTVQVKHCQRCGRSVRGRHPDVAADQHGATAHRLGPRVKTLAHVLHYAHGVPVRKVPAIIDEMTGVKLTQSAITQDALRQVEGGVGAAYEQLRGGIREAPVVHTDDTGWRIGGETAHLMVFDTEQSTLYQIRPQHRNQEVREVVPSDYGGVMVTDRGKSYDAEEFRHVAQQKCLSHLIRNISDVVETKSGRARQFGERLKGLLQEGLQVWHAHRDGKTVDLEREAQRIEGELTRHVRNRILKDDDNQRLLNGIGTQHDRGRVLRFLHNPTVEPTNNRAERALRPAVIARKVSHCSKNQRGAQAFVAFTSLVQTIRKKPGASLTEVFRCSIRTRSPQLASP